MAYHFLNIETQDYYYCDENEWFNAIETAKENYWEPDGTLFDIFYNAGDECTGEDDFLTYNYMMAMTKNELEQWDGSYFEKRNQIVMYEDSIYLAAALDGTDTSAELIDFIRKGSFRICSE